jgi:hypothetical protein
MWLDRWIIKDTASREINEAYINIKHRPTVSAGTPIIAYIMQYSRVTSRITFSTEEGTSGRSSVKQILFLSL